MKSSLLKAIIVSLLALLIVGCKKNYSINDKQVVLFQYEYLNYAWGYQHNGFIIDNEGNVLTYCNPEHWNFPDNDFILDEKQVAENIDCCTPANIKIPVEELQKYTSYINNIASSKVTALKNVAADAGSSEFICYTFPENTETYKGHLIKMEGDFTCENLNFYSKKITLWMKDIKSRISME